MVTALGIKSYCPRRKCKSIFAGFLRICYSINNTKKNQNLFQNEKQWAGDCSVWSRICGSHALSFNEWLYFAQSKWKYKKSKQQIKRRRREQNILQSSQYPAETTGVAQFRQQRWRHQMRTNPWHYQQPAGNSLPTTGCLSSHSHRGTFMSWQTTVTTEPCCYGVPSCYP